jgi:hypothetical protein
MLTKLPGRASQDPMSFASPSDHATIYRFNIPTTAVAKEFRPVVLCEPQTCSQ